MLDAREDEKKGNRKRRETEKGKEDRRETGREGETNYENPTTEG